VQADSVVNRSEGPRAGEACVGRVFLPGIVSFESPNIVVHCDIRLASFGGAGGQHATEIARILGIGKILIHRHSSTLSAYGLALADQYVSTTSLRPIVLQPASAHNSF
jgi:hypothetical protein